MNFGINVTDKEQQRHFFFFTSGYRMQWKCILVLETSPKAVSEAMTYYHMLRNNIDNLIIRIHHLTFLHFSWLAEHLKMNSCRSQMKEHASAKPLLGILSLIAKDKYTWEKFITYVWKKKKKYHRKHKKFTSAGTSKQGILILKAL